MTQTEPTITRVERKQSILTRGNDPLPVILIHVDGDLSAGSPRQVPLFVHRPGELSVADDDLIGLTVAQARSLAKSRGTILDQDSPLPADVPPE